MTIRRWDELLIVFLNNIFLQSGGGGQFLDVLSDENKIWEIFLFENEFLEKWIIQNEDACVGGMYWAEKGSWGLTKT